nr:SH3 domain-containing protein [Chloroflexota bacterium]
MHDDQLRSLLRSLEDDREPDPAFADALFNRLAFVAGDERPPRTPFVLLAAALLLAALAAGAALGSGLIRLPLTVDATTSPSPSASDVAVASPSGSVMPGPSEASVEPSATVAPVVSGSVLFAAADGLRLRSDPSGAAEILATLRSGQLMGVVSGPTSDDDMDWYEVRIGPGDTQGWVAAGPDGNWLALVDDGALLFRCDACATGGNVVTVTPFGDADIRGIGGAELQDWTWAPDGSRIAATVDDGGATPTSIVVMNPDGS